MSITGLNHYNLRAPRQLLDELRHFYVAVVGLMSGPRRRLVIRGSRLGETARVVDEPTA
jgi:hypothetical protein